jgi:small GTP-binding protein
MPQIMKKVCMVGSYGVGKTSLVRRFVESLFDDKYLSTVGVKIDKKIVKVNETDVMMMLWDLAGESEETPFRPSNLRGAAGYLLVADCIRPGSLDIALDLQKMVEGEIGKVPFILALNKVDAVVEWRMDDEVLSGLEQSGWTIFKTSAKTGQNVENVFSTLAGRML